jgi:hypothetical protein
MADTTGNEIVSFSQLLERADEMFMPYIQKALFASLEIIKSVISVYPPQPDRMRSGHLNRYVRGQGVYPASAFQENPSKPGGYETKRVSRGQIKLTSQMMDKKFRENVTSSGGSLSGDLYNDATYSGWVIGPKKGDPHQVSFHAETGWVNADDAIDISSPKIEEVFNQAVDDFMREMVG